MCRDPLVYVIGAFAVILAAALSYVFQQFEPHQSWDWNHIVFTGLSVFWGIGTTYRATYTAHKILVIAGLLGSIIFCTVTSSFFTLIIANPFLNPQVTSVAEIIDAKFNLVGDQFAFSKLSKRNKVNYVGINGLDHCFQADYNSNLIGVPNDCFA